MNSQTLKAFVSSTFGDLKLHRARVIDTLERGGFHVDPMEKWDASSAAPTHFCLERLEDCDLCVLIVAFRRGFIPASQTLSITQMEVQRAVEKKIDVLVFLLHDEETNWPAEHDQRRQGSGISEWRTELKTRYGVGFFRGDPASLDVGPSVMRWLQERAAKAGLTSPFDFASFLEPKREGFVGREWLFEEIEAWRTKRREKSLLIVGDPGIGKSAIVAELLHRQAERVLAYHCCRADDGRTLQPGLVVRALAAQAARHLPGYAARLKEPAAAEAVSEGNCLTNPVSAYEHGLLAQLARLPAPAEGTCYLVFDALDEALSGEVRGVSVVEMLAARLEQLPPWLRIVATTRREPGALRHLPAHLIETQRWDDLAALLTDLFYLEVKAEAGLVFELAADFGAAGKPLPGEHPWYRRLGLLEEALRLDIYFLKRHPSALFQTLWNRCWWYDCPEAARHYCKEPEKGTPPWEAPGPKLSELLEQWRRRKSEATPGFRWVRLLRPPNQHLGTALRRILAGHERAVNCVAVSPDGKALASGSWDKTVRLWDAETGVELRRLEGHAKYVTRVSFSVDGKRLASGSRDKTVRLWDAETGVELHRFHGHKYRVDSVSFSVDGKRLASITVDRTVRLWDAETGECLKVIKGGRDPFAATQPASCRWRAVCETLETVIQDSGTGQAVAWIALTPRQVTAHPSGRIWAGRIANYGRITNCVCLFALQGGS